MKQGIIANVRAIARTKDGEPLNMVVIDLTNGTSIIRGLNQFKTDLGNSSRLLGVNLDTVTSVEHPAIQAEFPAFRNGGKVTGDFKMVHAGEKYVDENPASPDYGKEKEYLKDHIRTDGFLTLDPNPQYLQMELNAKATASFNAQLSGMFASNAISTKDSTSSSDELPQELVDELVVTSAKESKDAKK